MAGFRVEEVEQVEGRVFNLLNSSRVSKLVSIYIYKLYFRQAREILTSSK